MTSPPTVSGYTFEVLLGTQSPHFLWRARHQTTGEHVTIVYSSTPARVNEAEFAQWVHSIQQIPPSYRLIQVHEGGITPEGLPYVVCESVTVPQEPDEYTLISEDTLEATLLFVSEIAEAVALLHEANVLHRGVQLHHLMLSPTRGAVLGGALFPGETMSVHASPEELRGEPVDERADVYGLGVLAWELIGRFDIPVKLQTLLASAVTEHPGHRLASAQEFIAGLRQVQRGLGYTVTHDSVHTSKSDDGPKRAVDTPVSAQAGMQDLTVVREVAPDDATRVRGTQEQWQEASLDAQTRLRQVSVHQVPSRQVTEAAPTPLAAQAGNTAHNPAVDPSHSAIYRPRSAPLQQEHTAVTSGEEQVHASARAHRTQPVSESTFTPTSRRNLRTPLVILAGVVVMLGAGWGGIALLF